MSQGNREAELFHNPIFPEQPPQLKEIMKAPIQTFWAAFHTSKVWSAKKNKKCLLMGRKAQYQKKENRSAK